jgi:1-acyl-sn-glycerol-3-phosphate acyltransferase
MFRALIKFIFNACGWKIVGQMPELPKWVGIVGPHTSNWDFFIMLAVKTITRAKGSYVGKHTIFRWPFGWILRKTGGIPVIRTQKNHLVETLVKEFETRDKMIFVSAPEGTRSYVPRFKTGFWAVAMAAKVPVVMIGLDFKKKEVQIQAPITLSGDLETDLASIYAYFRTVTAKHPQLTFLNVER